MNAITETELTLDAATESLLSTIISNPLYEADWIEMLSQLEYVGARKILKAVPFEQVTCEVLRHVSEETSHAFLLKLEAEKLSPTQKKWGECRFTAIGFHYFQSLDHAVSKLVAPTKAYRLVSWAVERRVLAIYPRYSAMTSIMSLTRTLNRIMAQEKNHSAIFEDAIPDLNFRNDVIAIEVTHWTQFLTDIKLVLQSPRPFRVSSIHEAPTA